MPCGGIRPTELSFVSEVAKEPQECYFCGKSNALHFLEEWDAFIHARCAPAFLQTEEGEVLARHGHEVLLDFSLEEKK